MKAIKVAQRPVASSIYSAQGAYYLSLYSLMIRGVIDDTRQVVDQHTDRVGRPFCRGDPQSHWAETNVCRWRNVERCLRCFYTHHRNLG